MVTVPGCVPCAFPALWGDAEKGAMAVHALFVLGAAGLPLLCRRRDAFLAMLGCGTLSCLTSCLRFPFRTGKRDGCLPPMRPLRLVFPLFLPGRLPQLAAWRVMGRKGRERVSNIHPKKERRNEVRFHRH